jgi:hypothetical protein
MEPARTGAQVLFPLDEELAVAPGSLTPQQHEQLAPLATWLPVERARAMRETVVGVQVSEPTGRRGTLHAGALYAAHHTAQSQQPCPTEPAVLRCEQQGIRPVCNPRLLLGCCCSCAFFLLLPCPAPLVLRPIIPGNVPLLVVRSSLQKHDAHPHSLS